jgi:hypothetical protein
MTEQRKRDFLPLAEAAERAYRELTGERRPAIAPEALEAAASALSVFVPVHPGDLVERAELEAGLARLRHAGVCFSEVRT